MRRADRIGTLLAACCVIVGSEGQARMLPQGNVTASPVFPAVQYRAARHAAVLELQSYAAGPGYGSNSARILIHDTREEEAPRDVSPAGAAGDLSTLASWESGGILRLLAYGRMDASGHATAEHVFLYSADAGSHWTELSLPAGSVLWEAGYPAAIDAGGPVAHGTSSPVRLGTADVPFVVSIASAAGGGIWGVRSDGTTYQLTPASGAALLGTDLAGSRFLVGALTYGPPGSTGRTSWSIATVDLTGRIAELFQIPSDQIPQIEGWITPDGNAYLNVDWSTMAGLPPHPAPLTSERSVAFWTRSGISELAGAAVGILVGAPTADFSGAWIASRGLTDTTLARHSTMTGLIEAWRDPSRPNVRAMFPGSAGVILETVGDRQPPGNLVLGFAMWAEGDPAPTTYQQLVLSAPGPPTIVHLDPRAVDAGDLMFVDPGFPLSVAGPSAPGDQGFQTQALVKTSLVQQLLIPATARSQGAYGATWRTDLELRNPLGAPQTVTIRSLPAKGEALTAHLTLSAGQITQITDVWQTLFQQETGAGALLITGDAGDVLATSRTYTSGGSGSYGMALDAVDLVTGGSPGLKQTFPAGILGAGYRSNLVATNATPTTLTLDVQASTGGQLGVSVPPNGQLQVDDLAGLLGASEGGITAVSGNGPLVAGVTIIDDATNDPVWVPSDTTSGLFMTITAIVHADGANGARYRSDLFLYNPGPVSHTVPVTAAPWNGATPVTATIALGPGEARRIPDVLATLFGLDGVATVSLRTQFPDGSVITTSRTYTPAPSGGTYGMSLPPLTATQIATAGETLYILGPPNSARERSNLTIVELGAANAPVMAHITVTDEDGTQEDAFDIQLAPHGGTQLNDVFNARGLSAHAAWIGVTPTAGLVATYATTIDNQTNDPVYYAGNLRLAKSQ